MSKYEQPVLHAANLYHRAMKAAEAETIEILSSLAPGCCLHAVVYRPIERY